MEKVTVKKEALLTKLRENRSNHRGAFEKAQEGFRKRAIEVLDQRLADARNGRGIDLYIGLPEPQDHTRDYDRVITMVEMSVEDETVLTERDFQTFVMDDWSWKQVFTNTNLAYGVKS